MLPPEARDSAFRRTCLAVPLLLLCLSAPPPVRGQSCPGDCDQDGSVTVDELVAGVNIALGLSALEECASFDRDGDGEVTVDEILLAVTAALEGCPGTPTPTATATPGGTLRIQGVCLRPGASGLIGCSVGTQVRAWRCDDRARCPASLSGRTLVGSGGAAAGGNFAFFADADRVRNALMLLDADVEGAVVYRNMDFGPGSGGAGAGERGIETLEVTIDPSSEAGVRLLDENGVDRFTDNGVLRVIEAVRSANKATDFAMLDAAAAAELAFAVAVNDRGVQAALQTGMRPTATPTRSPTPTPQPVLVPQIVTERGCGSQAVYSASERIPFRLRVDVVGPPVRTVLATVRVDNAVIFGEEAIDTGQDLFGTIPGSILPSGTHQLTLQARLIGSTNATGASCGFRVEGRPQCFTACDCSPGQRCSSGQCVFLGAPLYCCTSPQCPPEAVCQEPGGGFGICPLF